MIVLAVAVLASGILLYFPFSWLQSITAPAEVAGQYKFYANIGWTFLLISTLILLLVGNVLLWKTRRAWALWAAFLYFAVFTVVQKFWLDQSFFSFQQKNGLTDSAISLGALSGVFFVVLAAIIVFFDQYLVKRLHDKMHLSVETPVERLTETMHKNADDI